MMLKVDGVSYTNFTSAACEIRLDALSRTFNFNATAVGGQELPFKGGEPCEVLIDDETILTGFIEVVSVNYSASDHTINVSGRDKTGDLLDSTLDVIDDIRGEGLTLKILIETVIKHLGLDIEVIDEVNPEPFNAAEDIASPEPGDNAFQFIEKYSRKRQVLLTSNADGNVVIATNSGISAKGAVQHIVGADDNNVISSSFSYDTTGRFNIYKVSSGQNPVALNNAGETDLASLVSQSGGGLDTDIRSGRQLVLISESPFSDGNCQTRAVWEADIRKARGLVYSATVPGYRVGSTTGALWRTNRLYQIVDDFVGKIETMLSNSVTYSIDLQGGTQTTLGFVGHNAYTLLLEDQSVGEVAADVS